jgi:hypothetical protein
MSRIRNFAGGQKPQSPTCYRCKRSLGLGPKTVIGGWWYCEACTYEYDYPDKETKGEKRRRALPLQEETLFPLPTKNPDR